MIPPKEAWRSMESAPRDGTIFMALFSEFNEKNGPLRVQACQYFCNENGSDWRWRKPWHTGTTHYADGWMTLEELIAYQPTLDGAEPTAKPAPAPAVADQGDYDL